MNIFQLKFAKREASPQAKRAATRCSLYRSLAALTSFAGLLLCVNQALAQSYSLDWWEINAGGTSTGGVYSLTGTVGQPDAGNLTGDAFLLSGGFWGLIAPTQTPPSLPLLVITPTATNTLVLAWPSTSAGFVVQFTADLNSAAWSDAPLAPADNGTNRSVIVPSTNTTRFYRLKR